MSDLINDFNNACIVIFAFVFVLCLMLPAFDNGISYNPNQYVHVDKTVTTKPYYFCYCHNGRKDKVIHMIEVSEKTFNNCTVYHDENEIIHIGRNKVYLDASKRGTSFSRLPDVR